MQVRLGLTPDPSKPLFAFIGRLEEQKGADVLLAALPQLLGPPSPTGGGPMFNPQDGTMLYDLAARPLGRDTVTLANGAKIPADHWAVRGKQEIDDWYDEAGVWAGLRAIFPDKSVIEYRRV